MTKRLSDLNANALFAETRLPFFAFDFVLLRELYKTTDFIPLKEKLSWSFKTFDDLNVEELYDLLRLRTEVFVIGQQCVYQDMDGLDNRAIHICGHLNGVLVAYCRVFPPDIVEPGYGNFGRVAVDKAMRGNAFGRQLMRETIGYMQKHWPENDILIHAQHYLKAFYESLGFRQCSEIYDEVGIPHIHMLMDKPQ